MGDNGTPKPERLRMGKTFRLPRLKMDRWMFERYMAALYKDTPDDAELTIEVRVEKPDRPGIDRTMEQVTFHLDWFVEAER